jgi:hypothetical protein
MIIKDNFIAPYINDRKLVGLRWWQDFDSDGKEIYKFESHNESYQSNLLDSSAFWNSQLAAFVIWTIISTLDLLSLKIYWMCCSLAQTALTGMNLWGFYQCRGGISVH